MDESRSHGRDETLDTEPNTPDGGAPMPPIRGVRPLQSFREEGWPPAVIARDAEDPMDAPAGAGLDPWGASEPEPRAASMHAAAPDATADSGRVRGGGALTIPLLCIGIAVIAVVTLLPLADENHRLAWEREKLRHDVAHLREQVRVNAEFLERVADDPTLAERLAQRQMKVIRQGSGVLQLKGQGREEMSPFHLTAVPAPPPPPAYEPVGGALGTLVRTPRAQLYMVGGALLLIAAGLVLGYVPRDRS